MTDRKQALTDLLEKVEAGKEPTTDEVWSAFSDGDRIGLWSLQFLPAFNGSLDAAKALHEAVLPGWEWELRCDPETSASVVTLGNAEMDAVDSIGSTPARDWLVAIIKALISKEK